MEIDTIIKSAAGIIRNYLADDYKIFLFGSWAKNNALDGSDVDIGILGLQKTPSDAMAKIREEIENIPTLRTIDVVDLNLVDGQFKDGVLSYAKPL